MIDMYITDHWSHYVRIPYLHDIDPKNDVVLHFYENDIDNPMIFKNILPRDMTDRCVRSMKAYMLSDQPLSLSNKNIITPIRSTHEFNRILKEFLNGDEFNLL